MNRIRKFKGKRAAGTEIKAVDQEQQSKFLQLPGEIRNLIYRFAVYPHLKDILILHGSDPRYFGRTILHVGLFRVSRQVRAEALSYLVASKAIIISDMKTACAFFHCIGNSVSGMKRLTIAQQHLEAAVPALGSGAHVPFGDEFLQYLHLSTALVELELNVMSMGTLDDEEVRVMSPEMEFLGHVQDFTKQRKGLQFRCSLRLKPSHVPIDLPVDING